MADNKQEFSIEIPDKDADAIHSGTRTSYYFQGCNLLNKLLHANTSLATVNQAVDYILSQPDAN